MLDKEQLGSQTETMAAVLHVLMNCVSKSDMDASAGRLRSFYGDALSNGHPAVDGQEILMSKSESTKTLLGKADTKGTLAYFRSREAQLGVLSMVLLVFQGTALSLVLRYSR